MLLDLGNGCINLALCWVVGTELKQLAQASRATNLLNQINIKDRYRRTPLLAAIEGGNLDIVRMLLDNGGDPKRETKAPDSCNGIMLAFRYGHTAIAEYLLDHDYFELENSDNLFNYTLLHQAAYGSVDCVKMLLGKGANVNASSAFQVTPIHSAVSAGNPAVVAELLAHGADANATDKFGRTPLYLACNSFNLQIVKLLVEEGKCDVNKTDTNHNSAFDIANQKNLREICRYLLQHGAIPRSIKENASGLGILRFFRPYIASDAGHPDTLPTARTKAGLCCVGTKLYLNGGVGLKTIQNRPDESLFNHPNLLTDFFVLDLKDRKMQSMIVGADLSTLVEFCQDTRPKNELPESISRPNIFLRGDQVQVGDSNVPIIVTPPTPPHTPGLPSPLLMSRENRSDRVKVSKDGLTVQAMPQGYKSGMKKLLGGQQFRLTPQHAMASYQSEPHFAACVRATAPFTRDRTPFAYWEMHVQEATEKIITIGFTPEDFPLNRYHPGWCLDSYAYHNDDGSAFHVQAPIPDHGFQWGPRFTTGDIVGAGINFRTNEVFFTKNGKFLGIAYRGVSGDEFYPTISFGSVGAKAKVNLGRKPFKFAFQVPTLSWTKLGHSSFSPLALVPHPDGNGKFIQISYGEPSRQGLVSQRGNHWHSPTVCVIDTQHTLLTMEENATSKDSKSGSQQSPRKGNPLSAVKRTAEDHHRSEGRTSPAAAATAPAGSGLLYEQFVSAPFVRKPSTEERKREKELQKEQQKEQQPNTPATDASPTSAPQMLRIHHESATSTAPTSNNLRSSSSSLTRGTAPSQSRPTQSAPVASPRASRATSNPPMSISSSASSEASNSKKRQPYKRTGMVQNDHAGSDASSASSFISWLDDSHDSTNDSLDASFDYASMDYHDRYGTSQRPTALRTIDAAGSEEGGSSDDESEDFRSRESSGDEADEEDESSSEPKQKKPKRRTITAAGPRGDMYRSTNRNAPSHNPADFYIPECDYQVHYTPTAIYLFAPADEEEVQLVRLNIQPNIPTNTGPSPSTPVILSNSMPALSQGSTAATQSPTTPESTEATQTISPRNPPSAIPAGLTGLTTSLSTNVAGLPHHSPTYSFSWSDILADHPSLRRELLHMTDPHSALIQGHLYIFSQTVLLKLDLHTMKYEVKPLTSIGPRGKNYSSTVICPESAPLVAGAAHVLCFGGVAGNIAQSNVHTLDVVTGEWDVPHLSGVMPRPRVEPGGLAYIGDDQHIVVIQGGWNGKNYIDDLDFLHLEEPVAPDPIARGINHAQLTDFTIWASAEAPSPTTLATNKTLTDALYTKSISAPAFVAKAEGENKKEPVVEGEKKEGDKSTSNSNRKCLLVNRIILSARSSFFKTLFELDPQRKEFIVDSKTDFALFSAFIKYLYTDDIEPDLIEDTNAASFISIFSKFAPKHRERVAEELLITRPAIKSTMDSDLAFAVNNPLFADIKFLVCQKPEDEPVVFHGHRAVLCTRNDVFATMFTSTPNDPNNPNNETTIKGLTPAAFLEVIRYIYTFDILPEAKENNDMIIEILQATHRYGVKGLQNMLTDIVSTNINTENVISLLVVSDQLGLKKLLKSTTAYLRANLDYLSTTPNYTTHQTTIQQALDTFFPPQ